MKAIVIVVLGLLWFKPSFSSEYKICTYEEILNKISPCDSGYILCKKNIKFCLDIGANRGDYSRYLLNNSNAKVIAFEPLPFLKKDLLKLQNKFKGRFVFFNFGLGNVKKNDFIYYDKKNLQWANFNPEVNKIDYLKNNKKKIKLKIEKLDDILKKNRKLFSKKINLIKIDTEGYELEVLQGSKNSIKKLKPDYIVFPCYKN